MYKTVKHEFAIINIFVNCSEILKHFNLQLSIYLYDIQMMINIEKNYIKTQKPVQSTGIFIAIIACMIFNSYNSTK